MWVAGADGCGLNVSGSVAALPSMLNLSFGQRGVAAPALIIIGVFRCCSEGECGLAY